MPTDQGLPLGAVLGIDGLQPHLRAHARLSNANLTQAVSQPISGSPGYLAPIDIATAYHAPTSLTGSGETIAIIIDAIPLSSDLSAFWTTCGISQNLSNLSVVNVAGGPTSTGAANPGLAEATLDVEWASGIASAAAVRLYATPNLNSNNIQTACVQILNDLATTPGLSQVSMSFGNGELQWAPSSIQSCEQTFALLAAQGVTVFAASGDGGSNPNTDGTNGYNSANPLEVDYPASDPSVTGIGGTVLSLNQDGSVASETAWPDSGGGLSIVFSRPAWQVGTGVPAIPASGPARRCVPDIAIVAADSGTLQSTSGNTTTTQTQSTFVILNGTVYGFGGTSLATPVWAGFCALLNQARANVRLSSIGLLAPRIYPLVGTSAYNDITSGSNGAYNAGPGYDLCTGLGSPNIGNLISVLSTSSLAAPTVTLQPDGQAVTAGSNASFTAAASGAPAPTYQWQVSANAGSSWTSLTNAAPYGGTATAALTITGATTAINGCLYRCVATNSAGSATSFAATLTVTGLTDQVFLQQLFLGVLGRPIDSGALSAFGVALAGGESRSAVLGGLLASTEYASRQIEPAIRLYYAALARCPDYVGLQNWSNALHADVLTLTGAADQFAASAEFTFKYGSLDNTGYVQQLYRNVLGREADPAGLADWVGQLNAGATRGTILIGFSESPEFKADLANQVEIVRLFYLLLQTDASCS